MNAFLSHNVFVPFQHPANDMFMFMLINWLSKLRIFIYYLLGWWLFFLHIKMKSLSEILFVCACGIWREEVVNFPAGSCIKTFYFLNHSKLKLIFFISKIHMSSIIFFYVRFHIHVLINTVYESIASHLSIINSTFILVHNKMWDFCFRIFTKFKPNLCVCMSIYVYVWLK